MEKLNYEVAIIGSGPAGQRAAVQCAKKGKKVVIIDRRERKLGGVSLHSGTIPSKTLREAVLYLRGLRRKNIYGESKRFNENITLADLMERVEIILSYELKVIHEYLDRNNVGVVYGQASFTGPNTLEIRNREDEKTAEITAEKIIIATGTIPRHPEDVPFDYEVIFDSNFLFSAKNMIRTLPSSLIVYGAGVIGSEYAAMFAALGCRVYLVDSHQNLFPFLDGEIVKLLKEYMEKLGVTLLLGQTYKKIETISTPLGKKGRLETADGTVLKADAILFSKGRLPCVDPLKLDIPGVHLKERKLIDVDECYRTSVENIYAGGDVIGFPALASTSSEQGRTAARCALGLDVSSHNRDLFPVAIYTIPEISTIGKTEEQLQKENIPYEKGVAYYNEVAKAAIFGNDTGALKILFHPETRKILGIHIIGEQAAEIIHIGQMVMSYDGTIESFLRNVFNYPTWAEAYKIAALNGINRLQ
ncbi:MAG: Si-specific NAD(P)(+) transhydrogenase [bacterium]|nr:Si-specific NAD(P)(+) transhydrogenase [bacterium]